MHDLLRLFQPARALCLMNKFSLLVFVDMTRCSRTHNASSMAFQTGNIHLFNPTSK